MQISILLFILREGLILIESEWGKERLGLSKTLNMKISRSMARSGFAALLLKVSLFLLPGYDEAAWTKLMSMHGL